MARIFISYSRVDRHFVDQFVPLLRQLYSEETVWFDLDIHGGTGWWATILREVSECDVFVYLISNSALTSPNCQAEFREALRLQKLFLPLIIKPRVNLQKAPNDIEKTLRGTQWINISRLFTDYSSVSPALFGAIDKLLEQSSTREMLPPLSGKPIDEPFVNEQTWRSWLRDVRWGRIAAGALTIFLIPLFITIVGSIVQRPDVISFQSLSTPTNVPTQTPSSTEVLTLTPGSTLTLTTTPTGTQTATATPTSSHTPSNTPTSSFTPRIVPTQFSPTVAETIVCKASVVFNAGGYINQVRVSPLQDAPLSSPVAQGDQVELLRDELRSGIVWYQIKYDYQDIEKVGWLPSTYLNHDGSCP